MLPVMPSWTWKRWDELTRDEIHDLFRLRAEVFVVEQACAYQDLDGKDPSAMHLLGRADDGELIAYVRAFGPGVLGAHRVIGRVIVARSARGTGLGRELMREARRRLFGAFGPGTIELGAQSHLRRFYESLGYAVSGPEYDEDGIPHLPMRHQP